MVAEAHPVRNRTRGSTSSWFQDAEYQNAESTHTV
jgi:hypothetical protein